MTTTYGTLSTIAGFPVDVQLVRRSAVTTGERGFVAGRTLRQNVSRQGGQPQTRVWRLRFGPDGLTGLLSSFSLGRGGAVPLSWTPPPPDDSGGAIPVRFVDGTLRVSRGPTPDRYECEAELEEVA